MQPDLLTLQKLLKKIASPKKAEHLKTFFKTGPGQYAEHDIFLGIVVPELRKLTKTYMHLPLTDIEILVHSPLHEERLLGLFLWINRFKRGSEAEKHKIYTLYVKNLRFINNWDLVDASAHYIVGEYLYGKSKAPLYIWVKSNSLWERRIAMLATFNYIKKNVFEDALQIAALLLEDHEDLIHKAVGWMLREIGKRDLQQELIFLKSNYKRMPRTMLRYAIEKFTNNVKNGFLLGHI